MKKLSEKFSDNLCPDVDPAQMTKANEALVQAKADASAARAAVGKHFGRRPRLLESPRVAR